MPTIPKITNLTGTSVDILNAIRNHSTANYRNSVPVANASLDSIRENGAVIMQFPALQNEFLDNLINRIGRVIIESKMYTNPLAVLKRGIMEYGETADEIFANLAKPHKYDPAVAENKVFAREIPDVRAAFHVLNYQQFYKVTVEQDELKQAFLSWDGVYNLVMKIIETMYTGANYDEYLVTLYMIGKHALNGRFFAKQVPTIQTSNMKGIVSAIKGVSNNLTFMSTKYNIAGVTTHTKKEDQYMLVNSNFDAEMDVEVLASAFNMGKADFMGHRILIDSFGNLDNDRLALIFENDDSYTPLTDEEKLALDAIPAILVDRDFFMIFDNMSKFTEQFNGQGLYWNYWYHVWKTFSVSPFANSVLFVPGAPTIESVTVSPDSATVSAGQTVLLSAEVVTDNFASKAVQWSLTAVDSESEPIEDVPAVISALGELRVLPSAESGTVITATATSVFDSTKSDTAEITVS